MSVVVVIYGLKEWIVPKDCNMDDVDIKTAGCRGQPLPDTSVQYQPDGFVVDDERDEEVGLMERTRLRGY
jgi:hypothetical protein